MVWPGHLSRPSLKGAHPCCRNRGVAVQENGGIRSTDVCSSHVVRVLQDIAGPKSHKGQEYNRKSGQCKHEAARRPGVQTRFIIKSANHLFVREGTAKPHASGAHLCLDYFPPSACSKTAAVARSLATGSAGVGIWFRQGTPSDILAFLWHRQRYCYSLHRFRVVVSRSHQCEDRPYVICYPSQGTIARIIEHPSP
jgi:hypothetical protein